MSNARLGLVTSLIGVSLGCLGCQGQQGAEKLNPSPANVEKIRTIQELDFPEEKNTGKAEQEETNESESIEG